jgi:hypothetical protein
MKMSTKEIADREPAYKPAQPDRAASQRAQTALERFAALTGGGPVLMMTAQCGRSPVRQAAYRLRARRSDLDLNPSWRMFASLADWGNRWTVEQDAFAAGLILSAVDDPVVDRAVGRCLADLARLRRPLLWGTVGQRIRWQPRFKLTPNGWSAEQILRGTFDYARLGAARDTPEFCPQLDPILYSVEPDFSVSGSRLCWPVPFLFHCVTRDGRRAIFDGKRMIFIGSASDD